MTIKVEIPYVPEQLSKNRMIKFSSTKMGRKAYKDPAVLKFHADMAWLLSLQKVPSLSKAKTHVGIMVYRPDMRSDPANFIDSILDIVKTGIGVDDRWFSVSLDWELAPKPKARIVVTVSQ